MKAEFQLNADDFVDAQRTHLRKALGKKVILPFAFLAFAALLYVWVLVDPSPQRFLQLRPLGYLALGVALLIAYVWSGLSSRMQFRKTPALHSPFKIETGEEGITCTGANGHSQICWQGFVDFRESKNSFLLYTQRNLFFIVPKRVLQPKDLQPFRELAKSHITAK